LGGKDGRSTQFNTAIACGLELTRVSNTGPTYISQEKGEGGGRGGGLQYGAHLLGRVEDMVENILEDRVGGPEDLEQALSWRPDEEAQAQEAVLPSLLQGQAPRLTAYKQSFWRTH
jgi:hypothetical protein